MRALLQSVVKRHCASPDKMLHIAVSAAVQSTRCVQQDCTSTCNMIVIVARMMAPEPVCFIDQKQRASHSNSGPGVDFSINEAKQFLITKFKWMQAMLPDSSGDTASADMRKTINMIITKETRCWVHAQSVMCGPSMKTRT